MNPGVSDNPIGVTPAAAPILSVCIPTHNPRCDFFEQVMRGLEAQTLPRVYWELIVIDNRSSAAIDSAAIRWHPCSRVVREETLGLTAARLRGLAEAHAPVLVWVDDDNVLAPDYLEVTAARFAAHPQLGAAGGAATAVYEIPLPPWYATDLAPLGCRDLGPAELWASWPAGAPPAYPAAAPIGAGMAIRRDAMLQWAEALQRDATRAGLGRKGTSLASGEDNDINLTLLEHNWQLAYFPTLRLRHLIAARRLTVAYQEQLAHASFRDFTRVLRAHGASPWPAIAAWTVPFRKLKAWFACRAWSGPAARIRWAGRCGHFEGQATRLG